MRILRQKARASYTSRVVRASGYAGPDVPGVENRSPPIPLRVTYRVRTLHSVQVSLEPPGS